MPSFEIAPVLVLGAVFTVLGGVAVALWLRETRSYDHQLMRRADAREFLTHWPERPWLQAWRVGSWVLFVVGLVLLAAAGFVWWRGLIL